MGVNSFIAFFGIGVEVPDDETQQLEALQHRLISKANAVSLQYYRGNLDESNPSNLFLMGRKLSTLGIEGEFEYTISHMELIELMADVRQRLRNAGFEQEPGLTLLLESDS